jgi:LPS O-antigen subunit length determinant protein (WzzB/FepE family)
MENKNTYINQDFNNPDDIDLKNIYRTLKRGKKIIFGITIISSLLGIFYAYSLKPKWLGSFNIVVKILVLSHLY